MLRSLNRTADAVTALSTLLDISPTDSEAWSELADVYLSQGLYSQAIYALEQVLVLSPNAWNVRMCYLCAFCCAYTCLTSIVQMQARLGEVLFMAATTAPDSDGLQHLVESQKRFCRSIELCDDYVRGYYGLKLVSLCF